MNDATNDAGLADTAARVLDLMRAAGFDDAQVSASHTLQNELNVAHNEPTLLRSTEVQKLSMLGLVDGRMASTELADLSDESIAAAVKGLFADASMSPQDAANAVSSAQHTRIVQGPQDGRLDLLSSTIAELLAFRERETPKMMLDESDASHVLHRVHTLTSGGSDIACSIGWYGLNAFGTARDGSRSSSFNAAGGVCHDLAGLPPQDRFGIGELLRDTEQQIDTQAIGAKFVGDVVLTPSAAYSLVNWLLGQIGDMQLIAGTSLYRDRVGQQIASPLLTLRSRFDAPSIAAVSADAFLAAPVEVLRSGRLLTLAPSLYGSRKTGLPHVPTASAGWQVEAGATPRAQVVSGVGRGALVGRLSMGTPASNGDFSAVIKNSFSISDGIVGTALSGAMISGNIASMLMDVSAVSRETIDTGTHSLPWLRIGGLHFS